MPPKGSLVRWIEVKMGMDSREAERIEFLVRRKIAQKGYEGAFMFQQAFEKDQAAIDDIATTAGIAIAQGLGGKA